MKNSVITGFSFLLGMGIGAYVTYMYVKDMYAEIAQEEINSVKEAYAEKAKNLQRDVIIEDEKNKERLPKGFLEKENKMCILTGAVELMKRRVSANYKLAIPQCYEDKIQLLLPLCLDTDEGKPDLALAVTKLDNCYQ